MYVSLPQLQLLPVECYQHLCQLSSQAEDLPFDNIISELCHILVLTVQGNSYDYKQDVQNPPIHRAWNSGLVKMILLVLKDILTSIFSMMMDNDLKTMAFSPSNLEIVANNVIKFVSKIYCKYVSVLVPCDASKSLEEQTTDIGRVLSICYKILDILSYKIKFEKGPSVFNTASLLWNKLHSTASVQSLLETNSSPVCITCLVNELNEKGNFAITDCCQHLVCSDCAKKLFDVPTYQESLCPACHLPVSVWTDTKHFRRFKSRRQVKTTLWLAARSIKSALS